VTASGTAQAAAGLVESAVSMGRSEEAKRRMSEGLGKIQSGAGELGRDSVTALGAVVATTAAAIAGGSARAYEEGTLQGTAAAVKGIFIEAPKAAVMEFVHGNGAGGAVVGAFAAAHGRGGSLHQRSEAQLENQEACKLSVLQKIQELNIFESLPVEVPIWQLAELAHAIYQDPPANTEHFRCDLPYVRDPEEEVEAKMGVYLRRRTPGENACRDLAVLVIRGSKDNYDWCRNYQSIIGYGYPSAIVSAAAEIVAMYQGQGCDIVVTGHSLGGYLAEVIATTLGLCGVAFCAPGPGSHNGPMAGSLPGFHTINHESDHVGNHRHELHQAAPIYVKDGGVLALVTSHSMARMVGFMQKREDWTTLNVVQKCSAESFPLQRHVFEGHRSYRP